MAYVKIKILDKEAVIENYEWTAPEEYKRLLDTYLRPYGPSPTDPFPEMTVAREAIEAIGGEIVSSEPPVYPDDGKNYIY